MTATRDVTIWCDTDGCPEWTWTGRARVAPARRAAKGEGWTRTGDGRDLCPHHAPTANRKDTTAP